MMEAMHTIRFIAAAFFYVALHVVGATLLIGISAFHLHAHWMVIAAMLAAYTATVVPYYTWVGNRLGM